MVQALSDAAVLRHLRVLLGAKAFEHSSDADLLRRLIDSCDEAAFAALVRRHGGRVLSVCRNALPCAADAEDAFQATFLVLARKAIAVRKQKSVASWLFGVALRCARNLRKKAMQRSQVERAAEVRTSSESPVTRASLNELRSCLDAEIAALPEKYRAPFLLCCLDGKSRAEAAQVLGCKEGTLASRLATAREKLQKRLTARGVSLPAALAAAAVAPGMSSATIPASLAIRTADAALAYLAGNATGMVSSQVLGIAGGVLKGMLMCKLKFGIMCMVTVSLTGLVGSMIGQTEARDNSTKRIVQSNGALQVAQKSFEANDGLQEPADVNKRLVDSAIARLGWRPLQHEGQATAIQFTPDGKALLAYTNSGIVIWDAATGKERRRLSVLVGTTLEGEPFFRNREIEISQDGKTLAICEKGTDEERIGLWDLHSGSRIRTVPFPKGLPRAFLGRLRLSPDGQGLTLTYSTHDNAGHIDLMSGRVQATFEVRHNHRIYAFAIAPNQKTLAAVVCPEADAADPVHCVKFFEITTGKLLSTYDLPPLRTHIELAGKQFPPDENWVSSITFAPNGIMLAMGVKDRILLVDPATGKSLGQVDVKGGYFVTVEFTPDSKRIITSGGRNGSFNVWDAGTHKRLPSFGDLVRDGYARAFSPNGKHLAIGHTETAIDLWDIETGQPVFADLTGHDSQITSLAYSPDGKTIASAADARAPIFLWDASNGKRADVFQGHATSVAYSPDGVLLAAADRHANRGYPTTSRGSFGFDSGLPGVASVKIWRVAGNRQKPLISLPIRNHVVATTFSLDGRKLFVLSAKEGFPDFRDMFLGQWDVATAKPDGSWPIVPKNCRVALSPIGATVAVALPAGGLAIHDLPAGKERQIGSEKIRWVEPRFSADGQFLAAAVGGPGSSVQFWDLATGKSVYELKGHRESVTAIAWSRDGRFIASGDDGIWSSYHAPIETQTIRLWDAVGGSELTCFRGFKAGVTVMAFSSDGRNLLAGLRDGTILVFDTSKYDPRLKRAPKQGVAEIEANWNEMAGDEGARAHRAGWALVDSAKDSLPFLQSRLKPVPVADPVTMRKLIADLDSSAFAVRDAATKLLKTFGAQAEPGMRAALKGDLPLETRRRLNQLLDDAPSPETLRSIRAIAVLERIGNADVEGLLESLSKGAAEARTTEEATSALARIRSKFAAATRTP